MNGLILKDTTEKQKYLLDEIKNKVILGNTFEVLKKISDGIVDMVFIDPPLFPTIR